MRPTLFAGDPRRGVRTLFLLAAGMATSAVAETPRFTVDTRFEIVGDVSPSFRGQVMRAWNCIPLSVSEPLLESGWRVCLSPLVVRAVPELKGVHPMGWPEGITWENVDAVHMSDRRLLVFAEKRRDSDGRTRINGRVGEVLQHEVGHAVDMFWQRPSGRFSETTEFRRRYQLDVAQMPNQLAQQLKYYLQPNGIGRREAFAESFAICVADKAGVSPRLLAFRKGFPRVFALVHDKVRESQSGK